MCLLPSILTQVTSLGDSLQGFGLVVILKGLLVPAVVTVYMIPKWKKSVFIKVVVICSNEVAFFSPPWAGFYQWNKFLLIFM